VPHCQDGCQTNSRRYDDLLSTDCVDLTAWLYLCDWGQYGRPPLAFSWASCFSLQQHNCHLWLSGLCPGQPGWAGTERKHSSTHTYCASSIYYDPCIVMKSFMCRVFFHNCPPSCPWSTSWTGTLHFILHTFLHPIIVFFSQHMPIPLHTKRQTKENLGDFGKNCQASKLKL